MKKTSLLRIAPVIAAIAFAAGILLADDNADERRLAVRNLSQRADSGDAKALYDLAMLHDIGYDSIEVDSARSTRLYRLSAEKGYLPAQNYLGFRYFNGDYVSRDVDSALYWIEKAAEAGDVTAAGNLGYLLSESDELPHDYELAINWLEKASDAGLPTARTLLADLLRTGRGSAPDTILALGLYEQAICEGLHDAELKLLAMMGHKWQLLPPDSVFKMGRRYYLNGAPIVGSDLLETAAEALIPDALALLGDAYSRGYGVAYDHQRSTELFLLAALYGQPSSQFIISELLEFFPDTFSDPELNRIILDFFDGNPPDEIYSPEFWRLKALEQGISDAEEASKALLQPDFSLF